MPIIMAWKGILGQLPLVHLNRIPSVFVGRKIPLSSVHPQPALLAASRGSFHLAGLLAEIPGASKLPTPFLLEVVLASQPTLPSCPAVPSSPGLGLAATWVSLRQSQARAKRGSELRSQAPPPLAPQSLVERSPASAERVGPAAAPPTAAAARGRLSTAGAQEGQPASLRGGSAARVERARGHSAESSGGPDAAPGR